MTKQKTTPAIAPVPDVKPPALPTVALLDQIEVAKQALYMAVRRGLDDQPVPDVLVPFLTSDDDVLLVRWRGMNIYAVPGADGWIIRALPAR